MVIIWFVLRFAKPFRDVPQPVVIAGQPSSVEVDAFAVLPDDVFGPIHLGPQLDAAE
jgi:hypothetical protein